MTAGTKTLERATIRAGKHTVDISVIDIVGASPGPCLLLTSGVHGDEYDGPAILAELARTIDPASIHGRLLIVPAINPRAIAARSRRSPDDELDLNRAYPGNNRSITPAIAAFCTQRLLVHADAVLDLHGGGEVTAMVPGVILHFLDNPDQFQRTLDFARAAAVPSILVMDETRPAGSKMFDTEVEERGLPFLCAEIGGAGLMEAGSLAVCRRIVRNMLTHFGVWTAPAIPYAPLPSGWPTPKLLLAHDNKDQPMSPDSGFYEPLCEVGEHIAKGDILGVLHDFAAPLSPPRPIYASIDGWLCWRSTGGWLEQGESAGILAQEIPWDIPAAELFALRPATSAVSAI
jgi:N2-acetyl-L-2,4-diaminobutanoate deacetylase